MLLYNLMCHQSQKINSNIYYYVVERYQLRLLLFVSFLSKIGRSFNIFHVNLTNIITKSL